MQHQEEKNFLIFSVILYGVPSELKIQLHLDSLLTDLDGVNLETRSSNMKRFSTLDTALSTLGLSPDSKGLIYKLVAAIIHLKEIQFEAENDYVCYIKDSSKQFLNHASSLLNIDADELEKALLQHHMGTTNEV